MLLREARIQKLYSSARALMVKMPEYLKKVYEFFKTNNTAKDVLIGSVSFIAGGFVLDRILKRDEDQDEE